MLMAVLLLSATYFDRCHITAPAQCFVNAANKVIPRLCKGDPHYNIPNMQPLILKKVVIVDNNDLQFILWNVKVYGLENARVVNTLPDFENDHVEHNITIPTLNIVGDYKMVGQLLNQQVDGHGKANITIINGFYTVGLYYVIDPQFWVTVKNPYGYYIPQRVIYKFSNINSGNDFLGYQTNIFLNNNWQDVSNTFKPGASRNIADFVAMVYQNLADVATFDEAIILT